MPGFSGYDDFIYEATTAGKVLDWDFYKVAPANAEAAGVWQTLWKAVGSPGAGADPATTPGTARTDAVGSINFANQTPDFKYLVQLDIMANQNCTVMLYDRLVDVAGVTLNSTGNKTIASTTLPRYAGNTFSNPVQAWLEVTTATTVTAPILSMNSYTAGDGSSGNAGGSVTFPAVATDLHSAIRLPETAGKQGVQACSTINVATAASAGAATFVLLRRLVTVPLIANQANKINMFLDFPPPQRVFDGASLGLYLLASGANTTTVWGSVSLVYG